MLVDRADSLLSANLVASVLDGWSGQEVAGPLARPARH